MTTPTGQVNFCCISNKTNVVKDNGEAVNLGNDSFASAWNTNYMRNIRKQMVEGQPVKGCETCYKQEKIDKKSYRQMYNEEWFNKLGKADYTNRVLSSVKNNYEVTQLPVYLDLRLGNLCNLKCRMCNPFNSIMIEKEWRELDQDSDGAFSNFWKKHNMQRATIDKWYESENFWNDVEKYIPHLKKVYMTGGEPTLIEGNYRFLDKCKEMGFAQDIELFFNINFTTVQDRFIEQLKHFKWTSINASIDGFGLDNEYIRGNSKWDLISKNVTKLLDYATGNVGLGFSPVIQIYNILNLDSLLDYIEGLILKYDRDILVDFLFCFQPEFLDFAHLPKNIKIEAKEKLVNWVARSKTLRDNRQNSFFLKNGVESLINRLDQTLEMEDKEKLNDFLKYTDTLDKKRNQDFGKSFPKLKEMLNAAGY